MKRLRLCLTLTLAMLLVTVSVASAGGNANPGILPPNSRLQGLTYGEWSAKDWQSFVAIPPAESPYFGHLGPDCYFDRIGNVGFAVSGAGTLTLECEMPVGMALHMVVLDLMSTTLMGDGETEQELRECAQGFIPADLQASLDGVLVQNLDEYLVLSPAFDLTLPEDNIFGVPGGTGLAVSHGTWLMFAPLTPGQHTIHVQGAYPELDFAYDWTYLVTVVPGR